MINNNLNGTWHMSQIMAKAFLIPQQEGNILNIIANIFRGFPGMVHTGAARAGVDNFTKTLAVEWSRYNIRVNAVAPGIIQSSGLENYPSELLQGTAEKIPLRRLGTVDEVAMADTVPAEPHGRIYHRGNRVCGWRAALVGGCVHACLIPATLCSLI